VQIDALKVVLPPSEPIHEENKISFNKVRDVLKVRLDEIEYLSPIV
jgi:hypothetical protein